MIFPDSTLTCLRHHNHSVQHRLNPCSLGPCDSTTQLVERLHLLAAPDLLLAPKRWHRMSFRSPCAQAANIDRRRSVPSHLGRCHVPIPPNQQHLQHTCASGSRQFADHATPLQLSVPNLYALGTQQPQQQLQRRPNQAQQQQPNVQHSRGRLRGSVYAVDPLQSVPAPWSLTFDLRERETEWTEENKVSVKGPKHIVASEGGGVWSTRSHSPSTCGSARHNGRKKGWCC